MRHWLPLTLFFALPGIAAACSMSAADLLEPAREGSGGRASGEGGAGAQGPDGSIDVSSEGNPAPLPQDYSGLCGLGNDGQDAEAACVPGAETDGCTMVQPLDGDTPPTITCQLTASDGVVVPRCAKASGDAS